MKSVLELDWIEERGRHKLDLNGLTFAVAKRYGEYILVSNAFKTRQVLSATEIDEAKREAFVLVKQRFEIGLSIMNNALRVQ